MYLFVSNQPVKYAGNYLFNGYVNQDSEAQLRAGRIRTRTGSFEFKPKTTLFIMSTHLAQEC